MGMLQMDYRRRRPIVLQKQRSTLRLAERSRILFLAVVVKEPLRMSTELFLVRQSGSRMALLIQ